ncbi:MAG: 30S ribosomal protein S27ae [Candidatus Bathyarchaeota archaeon]|nr:MAG: 30S ribosomal protein S27ae [Candidatus Bathyarchaeota archaeon]
MPEETAKPTLEEEKNETEAEIEEVKTSEKPKPDKPKKREKGIFKCYKIGDEGLTRLRPFCERCGPGYFMADHGNRHTCGHCGFTRYKQDQQ